MELKEWQRPVQCFLCKDIIYSKHSGDFTSCKCKSISVDQTEYYGRYMGEPKNFIKVDRDSYNEIK